MLIILKRASIALVAVGLLASCASNGTNEAVSAEKASAPQTMKKGANRASKNAIYSAKIKNSRAKRAGYEWRDTGKMIKKAEKLAANGENDKAVSLANKARDQALAAIAQSKSEKARFDAMHGNSQ